MFIYRCIFRNILCPAASSCCSTVMPQTVGRSRQSPSCTHSVSLYVPGMLIACSTESSSCSIFTRKIVRRPGNLLRFLLMSLPRPRRTKRASGARECPSGTGKTPLTTPSLKLFFYVNSLSALSLCLSHFGVHLPPHGVSGSAQLPGCLALTEARVEAISFLAPFLPPPTVSPLVPIALKPPTASFPVPFNSEPSLGKLWL